MEDFFSGLVSVVVIVLVLVKMASKKSTVKTSGHKTSSVNNNQNNKAYNTMAKKPNNTNIHRDDAFTAALANKNREVKRFNHAEMEDRQNDWLAKELREEKRAQARINEMFQLKATNKRDCQAEMIRDFHRANCDAEGIDTAAGR